jgi:hypothetical protein
MTEEKKTKENETDKVKKSFFAQHPYLLAAAAIVLPGIAVTIATSKTSPTLVEGVVLEEKYVSSDVYAVEKNTVSGDIPTAENETPVSKITVEKTMKPRNYLLHLKVYEPTEDGTIERPCTLYVKEDDKMPVAVLDEVISAGSKVYLHYYGSGVALHSANPLYPISCFGTLLSSEIKVVSAWESSEVVKKGLEDHLEEVRVQELDRAKLEAKDEWGWVMY